MKKRTIHFPQRSFAGSCGFALIVATALLSHILFCVPSASAASPVDLALIAPSDLAQKGEGWVVLDARPRSDWKAGHIPGALPFSWEEYTRVDAKGVRYRVWPPDELARALGGMGIDEKTPVVVYGDADKSWGGEGWACWVLEWLGHQGPVRLLDGGIQGWRRQGYPIAAESTTQARPAVPYRVTLRADLNIGASELERTSGNVVLVDTRSTLEWMGGRIPSAVHIPWTDFYSGKDHRPLGVEALRKLLKEHGVDSQKPVVYYCAGGVRSGYAWTVHTLARLPSARDYEGGMEDWKHRATN